MKIAAVPILLLTELDGTSNLCTLRQLYKLFGIYKFKSYLLIIKIISIVHLGDNAKLHDY